MGLATAVGLCWRKLAASIPGFTPVAGKNVIHVGVRDHSDDERRLFAESGVTVIEAEAINRLGVVKALEPAVTKLSAQVSRIYLHFDLDVLDPAQYPANEFVPPDGLTVEQVVQSIEMIGKRIRIEASAIASFDPVYDKTGMTLHAGKQIIEAVVGMVMGGAKV
jgi:arginase